MSDTPPVLTIENYALSYAGPDGPIRILDDINLTIRRGEILGLVGESGSAKSSLANAIMRDPTGKVVHESGRILLSGTDLTALGEKALQKVRGERISMVFQNAATALDPTQTLGDHLIETLAQHRGGSGLRAKTLELLGHVGLPDPETMLSRYPHEVSGGEKQRVLLALALACEPELIVFDEPTSALDATTGARLLDLVRGLQHETGISGLFISHDLGTVAEIADRIAVIYGGRIVEIAEPGPLFARPRHPYTRALLSSLPRPSDSLTGRRLAISHAAPAPRLGMPPPCIYSASCPHHLPELCDAAQVRLQVRDGRQLACVRADAVEQSRSEATEWPAVTVPVDQPLIEVSGMDVVYGRTSLLDRIARRPIRRTRALVDTSLTLRPGETLAIVGESGCGKSTLARALTGLAPYSGTLSLDGTTVDEMDRAYRSDVQIIFQNPDSSLNPRHTIATILLRPLKLFRPELSRRERREEVTKILERVRLPAEYASRFPHQLSGGEKQRIAIARSFAANPKVIICDEITSGLDASVQAAIVRLLRDIQAETGVALIFITHDLGVLRHVAHRIAVMYLGEIVETRDMASLDHPPYHPYTEALMSSSPSIDPDSETTRIRLTGELPTRSEALPGCPFESRCPRRLGEICKTPPPLHDFGNGHRILCHIDARTLAEMPPVWRFSKTIMEPLS